MRFLDGDRAPDVEVLLDQAEVPGQAEFPTVLGRGRTGRTMGTPWFPDRAALYLAAVPAPKAKQRVHALRAIHEGAPEKGLKVYAFQADQLL
jgi:hypothetical protein